MKKKIIFSVIFIFTCFLVSVMNINMNYGNSKSEGLILMNVESLAQSETLPDKEECYGKGSFICYGEAAYYGQGALYQ